MSLAQIIENFTAGSVVSVLVILTLLIQISPLKLDPWTWIGDQLNKHIKEDMNKRIDKVEKDITSLNDNINVIDGKLNAHIVESYRTTILDFADKVMGGQVFTKDKWSQMIKVCDLYEAYVRDNNLLNGDATEGIEYIREKYHELRQINGFAIFPVKGGN